MQLLLPHEAHRQLDREGRNRVGINPVAPPPTEGGGQVGNLIAVAVLLCW
jgi:hypothetical protein